jgi:hypothetical protein
MTYRTSDARTSLTTNTSVIQHLLSHFQSSETEPLKPGHRYRSRVTGESFIVQSVQPTTPIEFVDRNRRQQSSVRREILDAALEVGVIVHETDRCGQCR